MLGTIKKHWKRVVVGGLIFAGGGVAIADVVAQPAETPIVVASPQVLDWTPPTTDDAWANESKLEGVDQRSDNVLQNMKANLIAQLALDQKNATGLVDCPQCYIYEQRKYIIDRHLEDPNIDPLTQAQQAYADASSTEIYTEERLKQAIQRIDNEVRLRKSGFVSTDVGTPKFGSISRPKYIRHIID